MRAAVEPAAEATGGQGSSGQSAGLLLWLPQWSPSPKRREGEELYDEAERLLVPQWSPSPKRREGRHAAVAAASLLLAAMEPVAEATGGAGIAPPLRTSWSGRNGARRRSDGRAGSAVRVLDRGELAAMEPVAEATGGFEAEVTLPWYTP